MKPALDAKVTTSARRSLDRIDGLILKLHASLDLIEARLLKLKVLKKASALQERLSPR
jgi:hypothetical protein